jgi:eukaryotic-like serine/threonine-protein kinase
MKHCAVCKAKYDDSVSFCPVDGEVLEEDPSSIVGTVLDGQYQIDAMLGKGGMGAVYRARHILLGDRVAIKILPPEVRNNAEWLRRFRREGQAARRFRHPNAVTVYDLRTSSDGVIYMVMEYVEGHTLDAEIRKRGRLTHTEAFEVMEPIMSVLNTAHAMGVVHRDLKPENIMIGKGGTNGEPVVKLLDLGIAKMREIADSDTGGTTALTVAGQVLGTPYYMSPEQWGEIPKDGSSEIDGRADIYSLGLVFYEMISGKRPYSGKTLQELRREHVQVLPPPLHESVADVPPAFSAAITRAISKDRGERQTTAGELATELRASLGAPLASGSFVESSTGSDLAKTMDVGTARRTNSDVDAPTVIAVDSQSGVGQATPAPAPIVEKPLPSVPEFEKSLPSSPALGATVATVAERADPGSSITVPKMPKPPVEAAAKSGSRAIFLVGGVLVLVLVVVGVGGFVAFKLLNGKSDSMETNTTSNTSTKTNDTAANAAVEVGRYWLEVEPKPNAQTIRVSGMDALQSGKSFKFHFSFNGDGNVYIVGPGEGNQTTAFLTSKPPKESGLNTNHVGKGDEISFPSGSGNWLTLDKNPGTENYTVVFSPGTDTVPSFLNAEYTGKPLNQTEQQELTDFLAKYKNNKVVIDSASATGDSPSVLVKAPEQGGNNPIIFEIRIQHK